MTLIAESISPLELGTADMKTFKQFIEEAINISGDFNGTPYELTLVVAASPISSSEEVYAAMDWEEISR